MAQAMKFIATTNQIAITMDGKIVNINNEHENFQKILNALRAKAFGKINGLINPIRSIAGVTIKNGVVIYNGKTLDASLNKTILQMYKEKKPYKYLLRFIDRLEKNPSAESKADLYRFVEANDIHITPDGYLLLLKAVTSDFKDCYTRTFDNSVGASPSMRREDVVADRNQTCARGLHVCSFEYLGSNYPGQTMVQIRLDPKDVVSVPTDYNNTKIRVCDYTVVRHLGIVGEVRKEDINKTTVANMTRADLIAALLKPNGGNRKLLIKTATSRLQKIYDLTVTA